jgi:hypothetical protein
MGLGVKYCIENCVATGYVIWGQVIETERNRGIIYPTLLCVDCVFLCYVGSACNAVYFSLKEEVLANVLSDRCN